jgi:hypothetical protein
MPSLRSRFESACRVGAFALLGWMLGAALIPSKDARVDRAAVGDVAAKLPGWTRTASVAPIHLSFGVTPESWAVDWLAALDHAGRSVSWSGSPSAVALSVEPLVDPNGGVRIEVAAPAGASVALRDDASVIDSARVASLGAVITTPMAVGAIRANAGGAEAAAAVPPALAIKSVAVIGAAGWEGKFIASALEERGWAVEAHFTIAPKVDVTQGSARVVLDTSRVGAVIAIDSTVAGYASEIERFMRSGGGLVLAGAAGMSPAVAALAPGTLATRTHPNIQPNDTIRLGTTGFYPVSALKDDGVALERRKEGVAVAARRVGAGRVVQVGYDDSWRWRMAGAAGSEAAHREWWSRVVASVAYAPTAIPGASTTGAGGIAPAASAPVANLVARLGPARVLTGSPGGPRVDHRMLLALMMILLLAEWASRRLRGKR